MSSPAWEEAPVWREIVERALREQRRAPRAARERLRASIALTERVESTPLQDPRHLELLDALAGELGEAAELLPRDAGVRSVENAVRRCRAEGLERIASEPLRPVAAQALAAPAFVASRGTPSLHALERLEPGATPNKFDFESAWAEVERDDPRLELDEQLSPPPVEDTPLRRLARDYLDEIGAMGLVRQVHGSARRHAGIERFEARLLENLDALAALGHGPGDRIDVVREVEQHAAAAFVPDPWRAFAAAFVLGCIAGREGVRDAVCMLKSSHPDTHAAQFEALGLCPNPEIDAAMRRLCDEGDARWLEGALGVLTFRGTADFGTAVVLLSHPEVGVRREAARALGRVMARPAAIDALEHALEDETNHDVAQTIAESLARLDAPSGVRWLRDQSCLQLLAVLGTAHDAQRIAAMAAIDPAYADAVGWYGRATLLEALVAERGDHTFRQAVARAVWRVLGTPDPAALRALDPKKKYRFGKPYSVEASLDELEHGDSSAEERRACALEVAVFTGIVIEPGDWVSRQRAAIAAAHSSSSTGFPSRRRIR